MFDNYCQFFEATMVLTIKRCLEEEGPCSGGSRISQRVVRQSQGGRAPTYYLTIFFRKLHENEEILVQRWGRASLAPPLRFATARLGLSWLIRKKKSMTLDDFLKSSFVIDRIGFNFLIIEMYLRIHWCNSNQHASTGRFCFMSLFIKNVSSHSFCYHSVSVTMNI